MNRNTENKEPGFRETLKSDLYDTGLFNNLKYDIKDIISFYLSNSDKERLNKMNPLKRIFFYIYWILKNMILKLTPTRRLILLAGILFLITANKIVIYKSELSISSNWSMFGGVLIILVLMLELKDKLLAKDELSAGRKIQEALMPDKSPRLDGWSIWLYSQPANEVCGDLVDFFELEENRTLIFMSDVAGKGLNAALLTTKLQAIIRSLANDYKEKQLISKVNSIFYRESLRSIFATLLFIEIEKGSHSLKIVNAGHLPPYIMKDEKLYEMEKGHTALGLLKNTEYKLQLENFKRGDMIVIFSDGVTESKNKNGDFFGAERLKASIINNHKISVNNLGNLILNEINIFSKDTRQNDDISLIIIRKN